MKKKLSSLAALIIVLVSCTSYVQKEKMTGLWEVTGVSAGEENMTPVAKWFRINADGSYEAGNGWLQNGSGHWKYDSKNNLYTATDPLDVADEYGGFTVSFEGANMLWEREEEGMLVKVTLKPIDKLPMSPADYLKGIWELVEVMENEVPVSKDSDQTNQHKLFIRWDRVYISFTPEGKKTGYWHIHGHRPEITLLPHQENGIAESWSVEVNEKELLMKGISESNGSVVRKYVRRKAF